MPEPDLTLQTERLTLRPLALGDCGLIPTVVEGVDEVELGWITRRSG